MSSLPAAALALLFSAPFSPAPPVRAPRGDGPALRHMVVLEHGPNWPTSPSAPEMRFMQEHGAAMQRLFAAGTVLCGGPAPDRAYGVALFDVAERAELDRLLAEDPAVKAGVLVPRVWPFHGIRASEAWPEPSLPATPAGLEPICHEVVVAAPLADAWRAWSTPEGAQEFFAPKVVLELRPLGAFEVLFMPDNPPGQRGAEGLRLLAHVPERMLAFEWNAPPQFARARPERTFVVVELEPVAADRTRVTLLHQGFAEQAARVPEAAGEWREVRAYFEQAWPSVLAALARRFTDGPRDWTAERLARNPAK